MERRVKERLVGAAVLVAAAIILIPEMLSGPKRKEEAGAANSTEGPFKTYTIDLNRPPGSQSTAPVEESAPPPEMAPTTNESPSEPESRTVADAARADSEPPAANPPEETQVSPEPQAREPARVSTSTPSVAPPVARQPAPPPPRPTSTAEAPSVPTSRGWAVQLGSFSNRATADRMANEFSGGGQAAFVMPVKSGANTLYRVRVGPFRDRAAADVALATIKKRVANAAVVAHP